MYAFLAYAAATGDALRGWLTMGTFGLGTAPLMILAGSGGNVLSLAVRARTLQIAAWCVVATGVIALFRGAGFLNTIGVVTAGACPFCQ